MNFEQVKHNLKWHTTAGNFARKSIAQVGVALLKKGRALLRWSGGRCSWCGADPGMVSVVSRKGLRCMSTDRDCSKMP